MVSFLVVHIFLVMPYESRLVGRILQQMEAGVTIFGPETPTNAGGTMGKGIYCEG